MNFKTNLNKIYVPSEEVVSREIEGEIIIVPLTAGIGDMEDELFALNDTGKAIWERLNGKNNLEDLVSNLAEEYQADRQEIEKDVWGLINELLKRRIIIEKD